MSEQLEEVNDAKDTDSNFNRISFRANGLARHSEEGTKTKLERVSRFRGLLSSSTPADELHFITSCFISGRTL